MNVRIAAVGVGHWHSLYDAAYLATLARTAGVDIVAIQVADAALAAERAGKLGSPPVFTDWRRMLAEVRPDFTVVLGRHCDMAAIAHGLLDEGRPFLVEKPAGVNASEVRSLADKAASRPTFAGVPLFQRLHPFVAHARRMLAEGAFGPLSHFYFRSNRPTSARYVAWGAPWMLDPAIAGGGSLRNVGLHGLDLFLHLTGEAATVTGAQLSARALGKSVEDYASVLLRSASGVLGTIEVGNTYPGKGADAEWKLAGRDAMLVLRDGKLTCITARGEEALPAETSEPLPALAIKDALARWQRGEAPAVSLEDCYRAMELADEAYAIAV
jgi:predicted dehydrogenase